MLIGTNYYLYIALFDASIMLKSVEQHTTAKRNSI